MKNILLISNMYPSRKNPDYGTFVRNMERQLKDSGFRVHHSVVIKEEHDFRKKVRYAICFFRAVLLGILWPVDCINIHYITHTFLPVKIIKKFHSKIIVVGNVYGEDVCHVLEQYRINEERAKKALELIDYLIVPSQYFADYMVENYNWPRNKMFIFPSGGVDENLFYPQDKKICRTAMSLNENTFYIGYVSRIVQDKGWDVFLEAAAILNNKYHDSIRFIMVGSGAETHSLTKKIEQLGLENNIFRFDMMPQKKLAKVFNVLDVFVFPTRRKSESLGLVGLEAMSCGTICVISNAMVGPSTYVKNEINSFTFQYESGESLAKKIERVYYMSPVEKEMMRKEAMETASNYNYLQMCHMLKSIFENISGNKY